MTSEPQKREEQLFETGRGTTKVKWLPAGLAALFLFPFVFLFMLSFAAGWSYPHILPDTFTADHWRGLFSFQTGILDGLLLSLIISIAVGGAVTALGFITSRAIAFHRMRSQLILFAYLPYVLSPVVYAACLYFFFVKFGLAGSVGGVILAQFLIAYPFSVIFYSGYWSDRLHSLEQLAATLGGNTFQTFTRVIIPISKPMLLMCFFQTFLISWFEYGLTTVIGVGKVQTLTVKVYAYLSEANIYYAALCSCLLIAPPLVLLWVNKRYIFKSP